MTISKERKKCSIKKTRVLESIEIERDSPKMQLSYIYKKRWKKTQTKTVKDLLKKKIN